MDQPAANTHMEPSRLSEKEVLKLLRRRKPAWRFVSLEGRTVAGRVADLVAEVTGSWIFIIVQTVILFLWIAFNLLRRTTAWDPLLLSFQAVYAAPIIMMAQNRQADMESRKSGV